jgi:3-keto-disaccharide hydrolase
MNTDSVQCALFSKTSKAAAISPIALAAVITFGFQSLRGAESREGQGWRSLPLITDGKVDPSWVQVGRGGFVVDDGALRTECDPKGFGLLVYGKERFGNCQIRVVFKCKDEKSNAGVYVRIADGVLEEIGHPGAAFDRDTNGTPSDESLERVKVSAERGEGAWFAVHHGYEIQIQDKNDPFHRTGAIYSLAPSTAVPKNSPGQWRTMIITLEGGRIFVDLDGERITGFDPASPDVPPRKEWYEPKREPKRPQTGYIGLQNHDPGDVVWYKEVSVKQLPDAVTN